MTLDAIIRCKIGMIETRMERLHYDMERFHKNIKQEMETMDNPNGYAAMKIATHDLAYYAAKLEETMKEYDKKFELEKMLESAD